MTDFSDEKIRFIDQSRAEALRTARAPEDRRVVDPAASEPAPRFGLTNDDVQRNGDLKRLHAIARLSRTFRRAEAHLKKKGVRVVRRVEEVNAESGGGRTFGGGTGYRIIIWPPAVFAGFHVLDVYVHEYGHVVEDHLDFTYMQFLNAVQTELGVRQTRDTHTLTNPPPSKNPRSDERDPFKPPFG